MFEFNLPSFIFFYNICFLTNPKVRSVNNAQNQRMRPHVLTMDETNFNTFLSFGHTISCYVGTIYKKKGAIFVTLTPSSKVCYLPGGVNVFVLIAFTHKTSDTYTLLSNAL